MNRRSFFGRLAGAAAGLALLGNKLSTDHPAKIVGPVEPVRIQVDGRKITRAVSKELIAGSVIGIATQFADEGTITEVMLSTNYPNGRTVTKLKTGTPVRIGDLLQITSDGHVRTVRSFR